MREGFLALTVFMALSSGCMDAGPPNEQTPAGTCQEPCENYTPAELPPLQMEFVDCARILLSFPTTHERLVEAVPAPYEADGLFGLDPLVVLPIYSCNNIILNLSNVSTTPSIFSFLAVQVEVPENISSNDTSNFYVFESFAQDKNVTKFFTEHGWRSHEAEFNLSNISSIFQGRFQGEDFDVTFTSIGQTDYNDNRSEDVRLHWQVGEKRNRCVDVMQGGPHSDIRALRMGYHGTKLQNLDPTPDGVIEGLMSVAKMSGNFMEKCK